MVVIVNYGVGNLSSVQNMLRKAGAQVTISSDPGEILAANKLLLPGVGHFDYGMKMLNQSVSARKFSATEVRKPVHQAWGGSTCIAGDCRPHPV